MVVAGTMRTFPQFSRNPRNGGTVGNVPMYAAYGMNMDPAHMAAKAPRSPQSGTGWLHGWRLTFAGGSIDGPNADAAIATVVQDPQSSVFVVLYDVPRQEIEFLDRWEGTDRIRARRFHSRVMQLPNVPAGPPLNAQESEFAVDAAEDVNPIMASSREVTASFYVMEAYEGGLPLATYLGQLADAAEAAGAPEQYVLDLRTRPCRAD